MVDANYFSPYIRIAMDSLINPPWQLRERVIFDYELLYIKEGQILITIEDCTYTGRAGDVFLFKPRQRHSIQIEGNTCFRQPHIHFDLFYQSDSPEVMVSFKKLDEMNENELTLFREDITLNTPGLMLPNKINIRNIQYFEDMLFDIIHAYEERMPFYEVEVKGLFLKLWAYVLRENNFSNDPLSFSYLNELKSIKDYIRKNSDKDISLDELSRKYKISKYHLSRLFKRAFGITPIYYSHLVRVEKARELIQYSNLSLTEISDTLGFSSINAFSRAFKNMVGVPPTFYRGRK